MNVKKVVLAYSGGLDTSVILRWLKEEYGCEVIAFCADLGQGENLQAVRKKARRAASERLSPSNPLAPVISSLIALSGDPAPS